MILQATPSSGSAATLKVRVGGTLIAAPKWEGINDGTIVTFICPAGVKWKPESEGGSHSLNSSYLTL